VHPRCCRGGGWLPVWYARGTSRGVRPRLRGGVPRDAVVASSDARRGPLVRPRRVHHGDPCTAWSALPWPGRGGGLPCSGWVAPASATAGDGAACGVPSRPSQPLPGRPRVPGQGAQRLPFVDKQPIDGYVGRLQHSRRHSDTGAKRRRARTWLQRSHPLVFLSHTNASSTSCCRTACARLAKKKRKQRAAQYMQTQTVHCVSAVALSSNNWQRRPQRSVALAAPHCQWGEPTGGRQDRAWPRPSGPQVHSRTPQQETMLMGWLCSLGSGDKGACPRRERASITVLPHDHRCYRRRWCWSPPGAGHCSRRRGDRVCCRPQCCRRPRPLSPHDPGRAPTRRRAAPLRARLSHRQMGSPDRHFFLPMAMSTSIREFQTSLDSCHKWKSGSRTTTLVVKLQQIA